MECERCIYRSRSYSYICDYISQTGNSKIKAIREAEMRHGRKPDHCPVMATKRGKAKQNQTKMEQVNAKKKDALNVEAIREMAGRGMSDRSIAEELGVVRKTILRARKKHQIPAGFPQKRRVDRS